MSVEVGSEALAKLRAVCVSKGFTDEDADAFVDCTRTLGRAEAFGEGSFADIMIAYVRLDHLIDKYPGIQREGGSDGRAAP